MFNLPLSFGKKQDSAKPPATERVSSLSQQGYSDAEIIRTLRTEGYSPGEADQAMKAAVRKATVPQPPQQPTPFPQQPQAPAYNPPQPPQQEYQPTPAARELFPEKQEELPPPPEDRFGPASLPELPDVPRQEPEEFLPSVGRKTEESERGDMEEIAEGLVEEKWNLFEKELDETNKKVDKVAQRLTSLETSISEFKGVKKDDIQEMKGSLDTYKESMNTVSERIEAMERAVKDSLTPMMQSLRSLSDTLKVMKTKE